MTHIPEHRIPRTVLIIASTTKFNRDRFRIYAEVVRSPHSAFVLDVLCQRRLTV
jgi:hypothetical protein